MTLVKICGITNLEDALLSAKYGADILGFNFYEKSPRYIAPHCAKEIIGKLPAGVRSIGVFVNEDIDHLIEIAKITGIDEAQLHGDEKPEYAESVSMTTGLPVIKAFGVSSDFSFEFVSHYAVDAILLDAFAPTEHGGSGRSFNWEIARSMTADIPKMYLAGGLSAENVMDAIRIVAPYAVDASSRLESSPGKKDIAKVKAFIAAAKANE